jgi:SAM-dependent methyltransferase
MSTLDLVDHKRSTRAMWAAGDYASVAERELWPLGQRVVERVGIRAGERVLDVACGTGNAAIRAASGGGRVTGVDLTPELFETGRRLATDAGVEVEWVEGDAEALPFDDESFDVVVSIVGAMFAPRHEVAARELVRMLRPGGRLALLNWAEGSSIAAGFQAVGRYLPPPPDFASPPWLWGSEKHVRSLFADGDVELAFEFGAIEFPPFESVDSEINYHTTKVGAFIRARAAAEADGRWPELRAELAALNAGSTSAGYLLVVGRKQGGSRTPTTKGGR